MRLQFIFIYFLIPISSWLLLTFGENIVSDTVVTPKKATALLYKKPTLLVLSPYDFIAGRGISPDIRKYLENALKKNSNLQLVPFSYKKFNGVECDNVFDKKYCTPILHRMKTDFILMSKIELQKETGNLETCLWKVQYKIYDTKQNKQYLTHYFADSASAENIKNGIEKELTTELQKL